MMKKYILAILVFVIILTTGCTQPTAQNRPTTWIFKLNRDYSGNWIGVINYYEDTDTYRSFMTYPLFEVCSEVTETFYKEDETTGEIEKEAEQITKTYCSNYVKQLNNGYMAMSYPNSEVMAQRVAIFDKSIITKSATYSGITEVPEGYEGIKADMGDSIDMDRDSFYRFVVEENPLTELYFCDVAENELITISSELANGEIDKRCRKLEPGTFEKEKY